MSHFIGLEIAQNAVRSAVISHRFGPVVPLAERVCPVDIADRTQIRKIIEAALQATLSSCTGSVEITAVCLSIAGMDNDTLLGWPANWVQRLLPKAAVIVADSFEIALVGAHGKRRGIILKADTATVAYGINHRGAISQVGGWGYDHQHSGGHKIGQSALRLLIEQQAHLHGEDLIFAERMLTALGLSSLDQAQPLAYQHSNEHMAQLAKLSPIVLDEAHQGNPYALEIVVQTAHTLNNLAEALVPSMSMFSPPIAFSGYLLSRPNPLSCMVQRLLGLPHFPKPLYPPVIGAAFLAQQSYHDVARAS